MASLNDFVSYVGRGVARSSHFMTRINLPPALMNIDPVYSNLQKITLFCDQAQLPGISYSTNQVRSYGEFREVPYEKLYESVNLSFYVDVSMHVKLLFDNWINAIQNPSTRDFNWPSTYLSNIEILLYDNEHKHRYMSQLMHCFPKAVSPIQLDYAAKDVMKLNVTMTYQYAVNTQIEISQDEQRFEIDSQKTIGAYDYGFKQIPSSYYSDFEGFQNAMSNYDFTFDGARSAYKYFEDVGEATGFGGLFGP